jgi:hypothetical protein
MCDLLGFLALTTCTQESSGSRVYIFVDSLEGDRLSYIFPSCRHLPQCLISFSPDKAQCESLAAKLGAPASLKDLPAACRTLDSVREILLQKRSTLKKDPFEGMSGAHKVRAAHARGQETPAQIQRRATTGGTIGTQRFSKLEK